MVQKLDQGNVRKFIRVTADVDGKFSVHTEIDAEIEIEMLKDLKGMMLLDSNKLDLVIA